MLAYILRRLMLVVPTLFGIMVLNFFIVQAAPGGPVEQMLAAASRAPAVSATERFSGSASATTSSRARPTRRAAARGAYRGARGLPPELIERIETHVRLRQADRTSASC